MAAKADQSPASRAHIAMMMAQQGDVQGGIAILEPLVVADSPEDQKLALVTLYCRDKQFDKALTLCLDLLKKTPEQMRVDPLAPGILVQSASVYEFQRRPLDAEQVLTRLQELKLDPGVYEQTIGDFRYNFGSIATAEQLYRQATVAAPKNYIPWMCLMDTEALMGHTDDMLATANEALKNCPDNPQIKAVVAQADLMKSVGVGPTQQRLISSLVKDPSPDGPAVMTLRRMAELNASDDTVDQVLLGLKKLAADLPRFLPAQTALIEAQIRLGRAEDAVQTAARVVEAFPTETQPAQLGVAALQAVRRPDEALHMAETWRARVVGDTLLADLTIAQIQTSLGQPQAALDILKPHLDAPYTSDAEKWQMLLAVAAADFKLGKPDDGTQMMWPAVEKSSANRIQWMDIIANNLPAPKAAEWLGKMTDILNKEPNSGPALMNMARDYDLLSMRSHDMHYAKTAREIAQHVEQSAPDIAPQAALLQGMFAEEDADFTGAEGDYRRAFSKTDLPDARNNLAMLLADHGGNLTEAVELVNQSIKSAPNSATYYDTLATLLERQRKFDEAAAAMQMALHLQPNNPKWHVNLASLLVSAGKRDQAKQMVDELDLMTPGVRILTKEYQDKLAVLRIQVGVPTTTMPAQFTIPQ
jgi:tetratricopeptide (TPR) repeat protein